MTRLWFKRRRHGYGWSPASWQGWAVLAAALAVIAGGTVLVSTVAPQDKAWPVVLFVVVATATAAGLVWISVAKGPAPRWRWGRAPGDDPDQDA